MAYNTWAAIKAAHKIYLKDPLTKLEELAAKIRVTRALKKMVPPFLHDGGHASDW